MGRGAFSHLHLSKSTHPSTKSRATCAMWSENGHKEVSRGGQQERRSQLFFKCCLKETGVWTHRAGLDRCLAQPESGAKQLLGCNCSFRHF